MTTQPTATALESLPATWSPADDAFFRVVASVFPPTFTAGAGVLLSSYDDVPEAAPTDPVVTRPAQQRHHAGLRVTVRS